MKWFFKWLRDGINRVDMDAREEEAERYTSMSENKYKIGLAIPKIRGSKTAGITMGSNSDSSVHLNTNPMNFRIYPATGGHIVEYQYYNEKLDRNDQALHLIPSELDMATELAKIMTLEALKR